MVLYRGGERMTVSMQLSQRPPPEMPPASELIDTVRRNYESLDAEWDRLLDGVTEAEAAHHPGPGQWSVKETMAHFILMERDTQSWFAQMINDRELGEDLEFRPNVDARVGALVELAPTVPALRQELRRAEAETLALLQRLPDTLTARRHVYRRLASWMLEVIPGHFREEHLLLMQAAVASARQQ